MFVDQQTREAVFIMEKMSGGSLQDHLMEHPSILSPTEASMVFTSLMYSLHYLHTTGIVHCDVKPDNILLQRARDFSGSKLSDFGLAVKIDSSGGAILNRVRGGPKPPTPHPAPCPLHLSCSDPSLGGSGAGVEWSVARSIAVEGASDRFDDGLGTAAVHER